MLHTAETAPPVNHTGPIAQHHEADEVHAALARMADTIVESGESLSLESLIKAFWRSYSSGGGNIVSIHEARSAPSEPIAPEGALARIAGHMARIGKDGDLEAANLLHRHRDGGQDAAPDTPRIQTSLPDRSHFEIALQENYRIARSEVEPLSVAICSVSRIDQIVDQHGLHTATRLMERIASTLSLATRGECYSARQSAAEFIMLARGITVTRFSALLEDSIYDLSVRRWHDRFSNRSIGMVDLHVGVAHVFDFASPALAMRAADLAHQRALAEGTSTVALAEARDLAAA